MDESRNHGNLIVVELKVIYTDTTMIVEGQEHIPSEVANLAAFFVLSVQVLVPIAEKDKNMSRITD